MYMVKRLKEYFYSIIPETLYDNDPVIKDILDVFLEYIEDKIVPLYNLDELYNMNNSVINEEILKTYLSDLYEVFNQAKQDKVIINELQSILNAIGLEYSSYTLLSELNTSLNAEYIKSAKDYKQKKGTKFSIEYIYNIIKNTGIQPFSVQKNINDFIFELDDQEYHFDRIEGSLLNKIYHNIVAKLTHPVGFTYNYEMRNLVELIDYFGYKIEYTVNYLYIQCINGNRMDFSDKTVVAVYSEEELQYIKIVFSDFSYIIKTSSSLIYYNNNDTINKEFYSCILHFDYDIDLVYTITDELDGIDEEDSCTRFTVSSSRLNLIGKPYLYYVDGVPIEGIIGLSPFVRCELTSFRQHLADGVSLYASSDELYNWYYTHQYEVNVSGRCNDNIECDGYGIVCGTPYLNSDVCVENMADITFIHMPAVDNILVELVED